MYILMMWNRSGEKIEWDQCDSQSQKGGKGCGSRCVSPPTYEAGLLPSIASRYARFLVDGGDKLLGYHSLGGSSLVNGVKRRGSFYGEKKGCRGLL